MTRVLIKPWPELAEELRVKHNGIFGVYLYFGHDGDNRCEFKDNNAQSICFANSGESMQEAVERCYADWCCRAEGRP
jgi:hypothetical protein